MLEIVTLMLLFASGAESEEWFRGGTVVDATLEEWRDASAEDRLASAAELVAVAKASPSMGQLRQRAEILSKCISKGVRYKTLGALVTHQANACLLKLGWVERSVRHVFDRRYPPPPPPPPPKFVPLPPSPPPPPPVYTIPDYVGRWKSEGPHNGKFWVLDVRLDGTEVLEMGLDKVEGRWHRLGRHCITSSADADADEFLVLQANRLLAVDRTTGEFDTMLTYARASPAPTGTTTRLPPHSPADVPSVCGRD